MPSGVGTRSSNREVAASSLEKRSAMKTSFSSSVICGVGGWVGGVASTETSCGLILLEESSVLVSWASPGMSTKVVPEMDIGEVGELGLPGEDILSVANIAGDGKCSL